MLQPPARRPGDIDIRAAAPAELQALLEIERRSFRTDRISARSFVRLLRRPATCTVLVARSTRQVDARAARQVAGYAIVLFRSGSGVARLYSIAVDPAFKGAGIGGRLLRAAERAAAARRCDILRLEVHVKNRQAIALYRKTGYREFARRAAYYEDGGDAIRFEKRLGRPPRRGRPAVLNRKGTRR
jgi:ribosomal protein S18 acetylase RimI-like enzyme